MCKSLFYRQLLSTILVLGSVLMASAQSNESLHATRALTLEEIANEELHHLALAEISSLQQLGITPTLNRIQIVGLLHTRYPELFMAISDSPDLVLSDVEVSQLLLQLLQEKSVNGINSGDSEIWEPTENTLTTPEDIATLEFLYGYELFKNKRIQEAQKRFNHIVKFKKGPYQYALYYSALADLMQSNYGSAIDQLLKVRNEDRLNTHLPYYLAAAHYGNKDYNSVVKFYQNRIQERQLHNIDGLTKIVAYAQFKLRKFIPTQETLNVLASYRPLSPEENYVLSTCLSKSGKQQEASEILASIVDIGTQNKRITTNAKYDYALSLADQSRITEAIDQFEGMIKSDEFNKDDLRFNILQLHARNSNYSAVAEYSVQLLQSRHKKETASLMAQSIDHIKDPKVYMRTINSLRTQPSVHGLLKTSMYKRGVASLKQNQLTQANQYFDLLASFDPMIEERGAVAAWKGIMAFQSGDFNNARRMLNNYLGTTSKEKNSSVDRQLDFNANYFLGYTYFKLKNHKSALGYFSKSLAHLPEIEDPQLTEDIHVRLGDTYFLMDNYKEAIRSYSVVEKYNGNNTAYAKWQQAIIADLENRPYDQLFILEGIMTDEKTSKYYAPAIFSTANTLFALSQYDKSATFYKQLETKEIPTRMKEEALVQLGLISVNAGDYATAENYYKRILNESADSEIQLRAHKALKEIYADYTYDTDAYLALLQESTEANEALFVDSVIFALGWNHYENGKYSEAINQWNKLVTDHIESTYLGKAHYYSGISYLKDTLWNEAFQAFESGTSSSHPESITKSYGQLLDLSFDQLKEPKKYLEVYKRYANQFPEIEFSNEDLIRATKSTIELESWEEGIQYLSQLTSRKDASPRENLKLIDQFTAIFISNEQWSSILDLNHNLSIGALMIQQPKHIYARSLAYMNLNQLDTASSSITDNYEKLLEDPAWLAKSILLLSDIYIAQDDKQSAIAALQALIETKSEVPPSLITTAKEKLQQIEPQN